MHLDFPLDAPGCLGLLGASDGASPPEADLEFLEVLDSLDFLDLPILLDLTRAPDLLAHMMAS